MGLFFAKDGILTKLSLYTAPSAYFFVMLDDMAFERKIIGKIHCPRCNARAELRIDQKKMDSKWVLVYVVCETCKLNRYMYTTTKKAIKTKMQIERLKQASLKNPKRSHVFRGKIEQLEQRTDF